MTETDWSASTHIAQWQAALAMLRTEGWQANLTCAAAPVQIEGFLPDGEPFHFRARHGEACLAVGGPDPADAATWERCLRHPGASYLPAADGLPILRRLAAASRTRAQRG